MSPADLFLHEVLPVLVSVLVVDKEDLRNLSTVGVGAVISNSASALAVLTLLKLHHVVGTAGAAVMEGLVTLPVAEVLPHVEGRLGLFDFDNLADSILFVVGFDGWGGSVGLGGR